MLQLKIIISCGPCEAYIGTCLASVKAQTCPHWEAYVTVDPRGDRTFEAALAARGQEARIRVMQNPQPMYSMANLIHAIRRSHATPEDVIVILDGDDWFATPTALQIIVDTYARYDCWMTYGSWVSNVPGDGTDAFFSGAWPAYPEGTTDFRHAPWLGTAVRTWKKWLWDCIDDADLRDKHHAYFRVTEDLAVMFPLLEMSGTRRAKHIPDVLMVYNRANPAGCGKTRLHEMQRNAAYLRAKPPYTPIPDVVLVPPQAHARPPCAWPAPQA